MSGFVSIIVKKFKTQKYSSGRDSLYYVRIYDNGVVYRAPGVHQLVETLRP